MNNSMLTNNQPLKGKQIVITGGSSGLGWAIAKACMDRAGRVVVLDTQPCEEGPEYFYLDVSDPAQWQSITKEIHPSVLFLNAGVMSGANFSDPEEYKFLTNTTQSYSRIRGVNLDGVVYGLSAIAPKMPRGSCIIVTGSMAGLYEYAFDPLYAMSKHAVIGLVRSVHSELAELGIRIHAYCPNRILTPMLPEETRTANDLTPDIAAAAAVELIDERTSGYCWLKESEETPLTRHPAIPVSFFTRVLRRVFG